MLRKKRWTHFTVGSCAYLLETVFVVKAAENGFGNDAVALGDPMAAGRNRDGIVCWIGDAGPQTGVWTAAIVV